MTDISPSFNAAGARPRRRMVPAPVARVYAGASAAQAAAARVQASARGELACRAAWMRVLVLGAGGVSALAREPAGAAACDEGDAWPPAPAAIAAEVERALARGVRPGSARALLLLSTIASARFDGGADADAIATAAVTLACEAAETGSVSRLHAALMLARRAPFADCLPAFGPAAGLDRRAAALHASLRFGAGAPLPELVAELEQAHGAARLVDDIAARLALLRSLAVPSGARTPGLDPVSFGAWTSRLQLAYFNGDRDAASRAALAAAPLMDALAAPADLLCYHLFAALALAWDAAPAHHHAARWHRAALARAAVLCHANAGAMATLAGAAGLASEGDVPGALRGYEAAAVGADAQGQTWVAALAWELAAALCQQCAFGAAMPAYRRRALMAWHAAGAHGRIAQLCQGWSDDGAQRSPAPCGGPAQEDEARRVARAGTVGELGVSIAHEVNQPLAAILLQAAAARRWLRRPKPDLEKALAAIEQIAVSGRRAGDIVRSVQGLAQRHATDLSGFAVDAAVGEVLPLLNRSLRKHAITAELRLGLGDGEIRANRAQVQQVVINLLVNAIDALATVADRPRHIVLASRRLGPNAIDISVADNGPGVAPADREHIFSALFSTKANGTGVGLSISRAIAEAHGGHIEYRPQLPHGAVFSLVLASMAAA